MGAMLVVAFLTLPVDGETVSCMNWMRKLSFAPFLDYVTIVPTADPDRPARSAEAECPSGTRPAVASSPR